MRPSRPRLLVSALASAAVVVAAPSSAGAHALACSAGPPVASTELTGVGPTTVTVHPDSGACGIRAATYHYDWGDDGAADSTSRELDGEPSPVEPHYPVETLGGLTPGHGVHWRTTAISGQTTAGSLGQATTSPAGSPVALARPTVTHDDPTGSFRCAPGDWAGAESLGYQWQVGRHDVPGETGPVFIPRSADLPNPEHDAGVRCRVTASNAAGSSWEASDATLLFIGAFTASPVISPAAPRVDDIVTCAAGLAYPSYPEWEMPYPTGTWQ